MRGSDPTVETGAVHVRKFERVDRFGCEQREPGEGFSVDCVRFHVTREELAKIRCFRGRHPVHTNVMLTEPGCWREPRAGGCFHDHPDRIVNAETGPGGGNEIDEVVGFRHELSAGDDFAGGQVKHAGIV